MLSEPLILPAPMLADVPHVEHDDWRLMLGSQFGGQLLNRQPGLGSGHFRPLPHGYCDVSFESTHNPVEPDPAEPHARLGGPGGIADEDQIVTRIDDIAGELGEAALEPDVHGSPKMGECEVVRLASVEHRGTAVLQIEHLREAQRDRRLVVVEEAAVFPVEMGVVEEVGGRTRLAGCHRGHELLFAEHEGVVVEPLPADRRRGLAGEVLPARGAGPVARIDAGRVGQRQQLFVEGVEQARRKLARTDAVAREQIGPADVADEHGVAGEDRRRERRRRRGRI